MWGELPQADQLTVASNGKHIYTLRAALIYSSATIYIRNAIDPSTALSLVRDASELLNILLENGHTTLAGRLAGAFRNIDRGRIADQIVETFKQADYDIRETDPFDSKIRSDIVPS